MAGIFSVIWPVTADPGEVTRADDGCALRRRRVRGAGSAHGARVVCPVHRPEVVPQRPTNHPEMTLPPIDHQPNNANRTGQIPLKVTVQDCRPPHCWPNFEQVIDRSRSPRRRADQRRCAVSGGAGPRCAVPANMALAPGSWHRTGTSAAPERDESTSCRAVTRHDAANRAPANKPLNERPITWRVTRQACRLQR